MPRTTVLLSVAFTLAAASSATAGPLDDLRDDLRRMWRGLRHEQQIESDLVRGHLRGVLGRDPAPADWTPRRCGEGSLERGPGGVPILYLSGTPEAMGRQHGTLLRSEIRALRRYVEAFVGRDELPRARARGERLFRAHCSPDLLREAEALAEAAGLPLGDVLLAQWFTDLYRGFACSTLAGPSAEGPLLARNLDFPTLGFLGRYSVVVVARPQGKRPYVSVSWPGLLGVLSGQNDRLALAVMVVHDLGGARSGVPFQLAFRRVLEEAGDVDAAEALLRATPLTVTNNLTLADTEGEVRVLELHPDRVVARGPSRDGRVVSTNHFVSPPLRQPRASFTYLSSLRRYRAVRRACPGVGRVDLEDAQGALAAAATSFTTQSMVFLPAQGAVEVAFTDRGPAPERGFVRLSREVLLGKQRATVAPARER